MRKIIRIVAVGLSVLLTIITLEACGTIRGIFCKGINYEIKDGHTMILNGSGPMKEIPPIEMRAKEPFYSNGENNSITRIEIREGIASVGESAFFLFRSLEEVLLPSTILSVEEYAFGHCDSLQKIVFPEATETIGSFAFEGCSSLKEVYFSEGLRSIGKGAFDSCPLEEVYIPSTLVDIGDGAFEGCTSLREFQVAEDNPRYTVLDGVLFDKANKALVAFPAGKVLEEYLIPEGIEIIAPSAFSGSRITRIYIPETVKDIGSGCFVGSEMLEMVTLPEGLTIIRSGLFNGCISLTTVNIPKTVMEIESGAFNRCDSLKNIVLDENPNFCVKDGILYNSTETRLFLYPATLEETQFIASDLQVIDPYAFSNNHYLKIVILPSSMESIGFGAFQNCDNLTTIHLPVEIRDFADCVFWGCSSLSSISLPHGVQKIGVFTVSSCKNLKDIKLPSSVREIHESAFSGGLPSLTKIEFDGSETLWNMIDQGSGCRALEKVEIVFLQ